MMPSLSGNFFWFMLSAFYLNLPKLTKITIKFSSRSSIVFIQFSLSVMSNSLWTHGLQHNRLPCPTPTPRACSNSCPLSQGCHPTISSSVIPFSSCLQSFPASGSFPESVLHIRWPEHWSFSLSISPSNEYSGLISFRINWFDLLAVQEIDKSSPTPQFKSINSLVLSLVYDPALTFIGRLVSAN